VNEWSTRTPKYTFNIPGENNGYSEMNKENNKLGILKLVTLIASVVGLLAALGVLTTFKDLARKEDVYAKLETIKEVSAVERQRVQSELKASQEAIASEMRANHADISKKLDDIDKKLWRMFRQMED